MPGYCLEYVESVQVADMKMVNFVSGLRTSLVPCYDAETIRYHEMQRPIPVSDYKVLDLTETVQTRVATVFHICAIGKKDVYVAYSEEVERLLGIPIRCIVKEKTVAVAESNRYQSRLRMISGMSTWKRLVFLFTKKLPSA